jgi:hypothetical protein
MISADGATAGFITSSTAASTYAPLASPTLTGIPLAPTAGSSTNTTQIATTAYVKAQAYAPLASPTLSGTPLAPTAAALTNTTQLATTAFVQSALKFAPDLYPLLDTGSSTQWIKVGTFTAAQAGDRCRIQIVSCVNYSADFTQHQQAEIVFATSNNSGVNADGFAGSSVWHKTGRQVASPLLVSWVANAAGIAATNYTLYLFMGVWTGNSSFYVVDTGLGTWVHNNTLAATDPGNSSSTVCHAVEEYIMTSQASFLGGANISGGSIIIDTPSLIGVPISITPTTSDNTTKIATTAFVKAQTYVTSAGLSSTYAPINNAAFTGTHSIPSGSAVAGTGAFVLPIGSTAQQPDTGNVGEARYNSTTARYEFGVGGSWINYARLTGDTFTGVVSGQTAATSDNSTKFATTAFVVANGFLVAATAATTYSPINNATFTGTHSIPSGSLVAGTGAFVLPIGTTGQQPDTGNVGEVRYNSTTSRYEFGVGASWINHAKLTGDTFTGVVSGLTATSGDNTTKFATTAFVGAAVTSAGGYSASSVAITGGSINGTTVGATSTASGAFTSLALSTTLTMTAVSANSLPFFNSSNQLVSATLSTGLSWVGSVLTLANPYVPSAVAITGGSINTATVGATTPGSGAFTSLSTNSTTTFSGLTATTVPVLNGSKQLVSATLGSGLSLTGTTLSTVNNGTVTTLTSSTAAITVATATTTPAITFVPSGVIVTPTAKSGAYTVVQADNNSSFYTSDTTTVAYTLPTLTAGTVLEIIQGGTAKITWTASGTTINCPVTGATGTRAQYSAVRFRWVTSTVIIANGDVS